MQDPEHKLATNVPRTTSTHPDSGQPERVPAKTAAESEHDGTTAPVVPNHQDQEMAKEP